MQRYRCGDCGRRYQPGGAYHRPGQALKERALQMYAEGSTLSAIGRVLGYSAPAVSNWVKRGRQTLNALRERNRSRTEGKTGGSRQRWCLGMRCGLTEGKRKGKRGDCWIWTAVMQEADGRRWVDFEVEDRSEAAFLRLYERLPETVLYRSGAYQVVYCTKGLPRGSTWRAKGVR